MSILIDIFRTLHPKTSAYTFFSSAHGTFSRIDQILGHKANLNKFKNIAIISSIFSDHNGMKLEINHRKRNEKKLTTWRLNNMLLKTNVSMRKSKGKLKNTLRQMIMTQTFSIYVSMYLYKELPYDLAIPLLGIYLNKTSLEKDTCTHMFIEALFHNSQDMETTQMFTHR